MLSSQINAFNTEKMLCDIDQKVCRPMELISYKLAKLFNNIPFDKDKILLVISKYLPCSYCNKAVKLEVENFSNVRLGKHERRVLLLAPSPDSDFEIIEQGESGLRAYESHLRAIRKLEKFRFLYKSRKKRRRVAVRLTPLGHSIVKLLDKKLEKGNPIRWSKFKSDLIKEASLSPEDLLSKFESKIRYDKLLEILCSKSTTGDAVFKALPDMVFRVKADGTMLKLKPVSTLSPFVPPSDFLGKKIFDVMPKEVAKQIIDYVKIALETGHLQIFDYQLMLKDKLYDYEIRIVKNKADEGIAIIRDISSFKKKEEQLNNYTTKLELYTANLIQDNKDLSRVERLLEKRETSIKAILRNPIDPTILVDKQRTILEANYIACEFFSKREGNLIGFHIDDFLSIDNPKDVIDKIEEVFHSGKVVYINAEILDIKVLLIVIPIFDINGNVNRLSIFIRELTDLQIIKSETHETLEYRT